jgi:thaumarchaeosortase
VVTWQWQKGVVFFKPKQSLNSIKSAGMKALTFQLFLKIKSHSDTIMKLLPLFAFVVPLGLLYWLNLPDSFLGPSTQYSFNVMWKGRTFQLFFIWLIALEFILSWETINIKISKQNKVGLLAVAIALMLPTFYVASEYYLGLNAAIAQAALQNGITFAFSMPIAIEYLVFSGLFCLTVILCLGKKGLTSFALPALFVALVGVIYTVDNVFPYGQFTPFQLLVPTTAKLAAVILGLMGYTSLYGTESGMPTLQVAGPLGSAKFSIAWPCAGIESLLIFTAVALLFLQQMQISWKAKIGYFAIGAAVTYFINVLRIATLFIIGTESGGNINASQVQMFHYYYGPLYSIAWIVSYPLIMLASQGLWRKIKKEKFGSTKEKPMKPQPTQLSPV